MASEAHDCGITGCSELTPVGVTQDYFGEDIEFFTSGDEVHIEGPGTLVLGPEEREEFQRLFMEAERRTEAVSEP